MSSDVVMALQQQSEEEAGSRRENSCHRECSTCRTQRPRLYGRGEQAT